MGKLRSVTLDLDSDYTGVSMVTWPGLTTGWKAQVAVLICILLLDVERLLVSVWYFLLQYPNGHSTENWTK